MAPPPPIPARTPFPWKTAALAWSGVGLFFVVHGAVSRFALGVPVEPIGTAVQALHWLSWIPASPVLAWAARRLPLVPGRRGRRLAAHAALAVAISLALSGLNVAIGAVLYGLTGPEPFPAGEVTLRLVLGSLGTDLLVYAAAVAAATAAEGHRRAAGLEALLARAELRALRMQLNPHFLFNALQTVSALTGPGGHKAQRVIRDLGDLLRLSLDRTGVQEVPLEEELEFLGRYLAIEQVRFQDRLTVDVHAPSDALDAAVPTLLLQPLVENAVKHGMAPRGGGVHVEVTARRDGDRLSIRVADDGGAAGAVARPSTGVGLANVEARLRTLYGPAATFSHGPAEGRGYVVRIDLPFRTSAEADRAADGRPRVPAHD